MTSSVILAFDIQRKKSVKYYYHTFLVLLIYSDLCMCLSALLTIVQFIMVFRSLFIKIYLECHGNLSILSMHNLGLVVWVFSVVVQAIFQLCLRMAFCILCCACKKKDDFHLNPDFWVTFVILLQIFRLQGCDFTIWLEVFNTH